MNIKSILEFIKDYPSDTLAALGILIGLGASIIGFRECFLLPQKACQELLDALTDPEGRELVSRSTNSTDKVHIDYIIANDIDLSSLKARLTLADPHKQIYKPLEHLL